MCPRANLPIFWETCLGHLSRAWGRRGGAGEQGVRRDNLCVGLFQEEDGDHIHLREALHPRGGVQRPLQPLHRDWVFANNLSISAGSLTARRNDPARSASLSL